MLLKTCNSCSRELALFHYNKHSTAKDGLRLSCCDCNERYKRSMSFYDSNKVVKHRTEEQMLGNYYDEFCRKVEEFKRVSEVY